MFTKREPCTSKSVDLTSISPQLSWHSSLALVTTKPPVRAVLALKKTGFSFRPIVGSSSVVVVAAVVGAVVGFTDAGVRGTVVVKAIAGVRVVVGLVLGAAGAWVIELREVVEFVEVVVLPVVVVVVLEVLVVAASSA